MSHSALAQDFQVGPGRPRDIFFFIREVVSGAWRQHFGTQFCSLPMTEKEFGMRCAKAILADAFPFIHFAAADQFVVVRHHHELVGAALCSSDPVRAASSLASIEVVVVDGRWRRQGIGRALVSYFQKRAPAGHVLECYCAAKSRSMVRLLKHLGFVRTHRLLECVNENGQRVRLPERWAWHARNGDRSVDHSPPKAVNVKKRTAA